MVLIVFTMMPLDSGMIIHSFDFIMIGRMILVQSLTLVSFFYPLKEKNTSTTSKFFFFLKKKPSNAGYVNKKKKNIIIFCNQVLRIVIWS